MRTTRRILSLRGSLHYSLRSAFQLGSCLNTRTTHHLNFPRHPQLRRLFTRYSSSSGCSSTSNTTSQSSPYLAFTLLASTALALTYTITPSRPTHNSGPSNQPTSSPDNELENLTTFECQPIPALDLATATARLRNEEFSTQFAPKLATGVTRFDGVRVPSNNPSEDEHTHSTEYIGDNSEWRFWGVFDGHAGWATSQVLKSHLARYVARALRRARNLDPTLTPESVDNAIKLGFLELDHEIMTDGLEAMDKQTPLAEGVARIAPARAGSCALLAAFDPTTSILRVACTGDSRAVLGRYDDATNSYTAEALSEDQTGFNEAEVKRLAAAHPNEPDIIDPKTGRLLGMAVTRGFGDHRWKWPLERIKECQTYYAGSSPRPLYQTPPYMTAEPEVTTTKIQKGDFLILASDGLWDHIDTEHAVECVSLWVMRQQQRRRIISEMPPTPPASPSPNATKTTDRFQLNYWYYCTPEHFVVEDKNAATHLVRNAFGGNRTELFCGVMTVQPPDSRNIRDDTTVQVVFFGDVLGMKVEDGRPA